MLKLKHAVLLNVSMCIVVNIADSLLTIVVSTGHWRILERRLVCMALNYRTSKYFYFPEITEEILFGGGN